MPTPEPKMVLFGPFQLDLISGELRKQGHAIHLPYQPARVLTLLAGQAGKIVSRAEIQKQLWDGATFVDFEQGLNNCVAQVRTSLEDNAAKPRYIETLFKQDIASLRQWRAASELLGA